MRLRSFFLSFFFCIPSWAISIQVIPTLPGAEYSIVRGVSADGKTVVGESGGKGFIYSHGMTSEIEPLAGNAETSLHAVSADGRIAVGTSQEYRFSQAIKSSDGMVEVLGHLTDSAPYSFAYDISDDGAMIVGGSRVRRENGRFVQTYVVPAVFENGLAIEIGSLECNPDVLPFRSGVANAVSSDGQVIVGQSCGKAFSYQNGVMKDLGTLTSQNPPLCGASQVIRSEASDVSADGSRIVGHSVYYTEVYHAFLYDEGVMKPLSETSGVGGSYANAISGNGRVVVGQIRRAGNNEAAIWIERENGEFRAYLLSDYLSDLGLDLKRRGWEQFWSLDDVSADGKQLVGSGVKDGRYEIFLIDLSKKKEKKKKTKKRKFCRDWGYCGSDFYK